MKEYLELLESLKPILINRPRAEEDTRSTEEEKDDGNSAESGQSNR